MTEQLAASAASAMGATLVHTDVLRTLIAPCAGHPDYDEMWTL